VLGRTLQLTAILLAVSALRGQDAPPRASVSPSAPTAAPNPRSTGAPFLRVLRAEDYHASPVNWRVLQHPTTGLIYVSNNFGVLEFDGSTTRLIPMPRGGAARALVVDATGQIWVGGLGELARLVPNAAGQLVALDATDQIAAGATGKENADSADDAEGPANTRGPAPLRGLGNLNRAIAGPEGVYFRLPDTIARLSPDGTARLIPAAARLGQMLWLDGGLHANDLDRGLTRIRDDRLEVLTGVGKVDAFAAQRDPRGGWRLLSLRGPLYWAGPGHAPQATSPDGERLFANEDPLCAIFLADGRAAYGTTRSGLYLFDATGRLERQIERTHGMPANRVNGLAQDREGGLWLAMHTGLVRVELDSPFAVHGPAQGLAGGPRYLLRAGPRLYVTHGEGLAWRDDATGQFQPVAGFRSGSHRLLPWRNHLLATSLGLHEIDPATNEATHFVGSSLYAATALQRSPDWLLVSSAQSLRFFRQDDGVTWKQNGASQTLRTGADDLLETPDGQVWVVTRTGEVWRLDVRGGVTPEAPAFSYALDRGLPPLLRRDNPRLLRLGGDLYVASVRGLFRYDPAQDRFLAETRWTTELNSTSRRGPSMSVPAADGGAWFYFEDSPPWIAHLKPAPNHTWTVEKIPAAPLRDLVLNHLYDDPSLHTLWVAAQGALVSVDTAWQPAQTHPPLRTLIRSVATPDGSTIPLSRLPALEPRFTSLRFTYAAPFFGTDYTGQTDTRFRTRLAGFDSGWSAWTAEPYRDFTNLPPGAFTFEVQSRDFAGRISEPTTLAFQLVAPWWRASWLAVAGILVGVGVFAGLVRLRTHTLRYQNARLESVIADRTRELADRNQELERLRQHEAGEKIAAQIAEERAQLEMLRYQLNPHFLFNALNSVYGLVFPHSRPAGELVRRLAEFYRGTLTRTANQWHSLGEETAMLRTYLDIEQARWRDRLKVEFILDPGTLATRLPSFLLLPLLENAVKHGGASSPALLTIRVSAVLNDLGETVLEIINSGRWIPATEPRDTPSTGIGMENLVARLHRNFPARHELTILPGDGWVTIRLRLTPPPASPEPRAL
jgi:hypothetical protein